MDETEFQTLRKKKTMAKHGKTSVDAKALTTTKHMRRRKKISKNRKAAQRIPKGRKSEARGKGIALPQSEDLILQPPSVAIFEDHMQIRMIPTPPNLVRRELHDTDSERTISTGPSTSNTHMAGPSTSSSGQSSHNKTFIHPIGNTT
nr:uncharacterized protein LOC109173336 isoform X2 [Ipomoea batatas]